MLSPACRRFRAAYSADLADPHQDQCPDCRSWAEQIAGLPQLRLDLPLPEELHAQLLAIPGPEARPKTPVAASRVEPLPQAPFPEGLRRQLLQIPKTERSARPPLWITSSRYGVAASLLVTCLSISALGDTIHQGQRTTAAWSRTADQSIRTVNLKGQETLSLCEESLAGSYTKVQATMATWPDRATRAWHGLGDLVQELVYRVESLSQPKEQAHDNRPEPTD